MAAYGSPARRGCEARSWSARPGSEQGRNDDERRHLDAVRPAGSPPGRTRRDRRRRHRTVLVGDADDPAGLPGGPLRPARRPVAADPPRGRREGRPGLGDVLVRGRRRTDPVRRRRPRVQTRPPGNRPAAAPRIRRLLNPYFLPGVVNALEDETRAIANELIDTFADGGSCEFMSQYAVALPAHILFRTMLGLGVDSLGQALEWVDRLVMEPDAAMEVFMELMPWCYQTLEARQAVQGDGVMDAINHGLVEGERPLDEFERVEVLVLLIIGGLETTANALGNIGLHIATE